MELVKEHMGDFLAIIGAAYALALVIVKLTPTPKDNEAVEKVATWITAICAVFGLNPFQGVNKRPKA